MVNLPCCSGKDVRLADAATQDASISSSSTPAASAMSDVCDVSPPSQILIGEVTSFFVKTERAQEKTIVTADCCYFNPLLRRIVRFLGQLRSEGLEVI